MLEEITTQHGILVLVALLGFLVLAGLCLSERAFTQLLAHLARRGYKGEASEKDAPLVVTSSYIGPERRRKSRRKDDARSTSGKRSGK